MAAADIKRAEDNGATPEHVKALESLWSVMLRRLDPDASMGTVAARVFDVVEDYIGRRRGEQVRGQSIRREVAALKRAFTIAHRRGLIDAMPTHWPTVKSDPLDPLQRGKLRPPEVIQAVLEQVSQDARDELLFVALTGLRATEVKRLATSWVEPAAPSASVPAVLRVPAHSAKNRRERVVGLPETALGIIKRRVAANPTAERVFSQSNHKKAVRAASQRAGLPDTLTLRDMRHTYGTLALRGTADPVAVQAALGHSDLKTTQRYLSSTIERTTSAGAAVADALVGVQNRHTETGTQNESVLTGALSTGTVDDFWSGRRGSNSRPSAWEASHKV